VSLHCSSVVLCLCGTALAHLLCAQVATVTVSPNPASVNQQTQITVTGNNPCKKIDITFGDSQSVSPNNVTLPYGVSHAWTSPGTYPVVAQGVSPCSGQASTSVKIQSAPISIPPGSLANLCKMIDCTGQPHIKMYFGFSSPGGPGAVIGSWFGSKPNKVIAKLSKWDGTPEVLTLAIDEWHNTWIGVEWPTGIVGVREQWAKIQVTTSTGQVSNESSVLFVPDPDYMILPASDVQLVHCGTDTEADGCNGWTDPDDEGAFFSGCSTCTFYGSHWRSPFCSPFCCYIVSDTDAFKMTVKNDWVLQSFSFEYVANQELLESLQIVGGVSEFPYGTTWQPSVTWADECGDDYAYYGYVGISGPKGVPYK